MNSFPEYATPPGYVDTPFIYVYDPNALVNGAWTPDVLNSPTGGTGYVAPGPQANLNVPLVYGESFFVLRKVNPTLMSVGPQLYSDDPGGIVLRDFRQVPRSNQPRPLLPSSLTGSATPGNSAWPILPEMAFPRQSQMNFDLFGVVTQSNGASPADANSVPLSQILFQGVRRYPSTTPPDNRCWSEKTYTYAVDVLVDWPYYNNADPAQGVSSPRLFMVNIRNWDFELMELRTYGDYVPGVSGGQLPCLATARIQLLDASQTALSQVPVNLDAINSAQRSGMASTLQPGSIPGVNNGFGSYAGAGAFCPPVFYPQNTQIQFRIQSLLNAVNSPASNTITLEFVGHRRLKTR